MRSFKVLTELPDGYFVEEGPRGVLAVHAAAARILHATGYGPQTDGQLSPSDLRGRNPLFQLEHGGERLAVRRFSHGGAMRWVTGSRFLDPDRPFRELILSDRLRRVGIPTPQVVAARAVAVRGGGWKLDLITRRIEGAMGLGELLEELVQDKLAVRVRQRVLGAAGDLVRRLHKHGCHHADLTPNNILVDRRALEGAEPQLWILDLDRSVVRRELGDRERRDNLRRLFRYIHRRERRLGRVLERGDYARFLRGYDPERVRWKRDWRAIVTAHSHHGLVHGLGWFAENLFSDRGHALAPKD